MKDLIGKWKIDEILMFDEQASDMAWVKVADALKKPDLDEDYKRMVNAIIEFTTNNKMEMLFPIPDDLPKEELDEALASGEVSMKDDMILAESFDWKIENGKPYYDSKAEGEVLGEKVNPWVELKETPDGYEIMTFRIVKA